MERKRSSNNNNLTIGAILLVIVSAVIILIIFVLTYKKETRITGTTDDSETSSLVCDLASNESAFFESNAKEYKHELRVMFIDDIVSQIAYEYRGVYDSWQDADRDEGIMHANYNNYMGAHGLDSNVLTPVFQNVDGNLKILLYLKSYKHINSAVGRLFYINSASLELMAKYSVEEVKNYYENKGFSCIIGD